MISAWVLYVHNARYYFEELQSQTKLQSTIPLEWGLPKDAIIILVLQKGEFLDAFLGGVSVRKW